MADNIVQVANRNRGLLRRRARTRERELEAAYRALLRDARTAERRLRAQMDRYRAAGVPITPELVAADRWYRALIAGYKSGLDALAPTVWDVVRDLIRDALHWGRRDYTDMVGAPSVGQVRALTEYATAVTSRGPLAQLIGDRSGPAADRVAELLRRAMVESWSPADTGAALNRAVNGEFRNAVTVARTEQMRAYRYAAFETMRAAGVTRWVWWSRLMPGSTCAFCWAQHGRTFPLSKPMGSHPNCACVPIPVRDGVDFGPTGAEAFDDLDPDIQQEILGPAAHAAYEAGDLQLIDLVREWRHPDWGPVGGSRSLADAIGPVKAGRYVAAMHQARTV